jgi:hypothetical protein
VRTDVSTLVTLDTVVLVPSGNEGLHTALLISSGTNHPRTVNSVVLHEVRNLQQVTGLSVHRTNEVLHECGSVVSLLSIVSQVSPLRLNCQLYILTTPLGDVGDALLANNRANAIKLEQML